MPETQAHVPMDQVHRGTASSLALEKERDPEAARDTGTVRAPQMPGWAGPTGEGGANRGAQGPFGGSAPTTRASGSLAGVRADKGDCGFIACPWGTPRYIPGHLLNHSARPRSAKALSRRRVCQLNVTATPPGPRQGGERPSVGTQCHSQVGLRPSQGAPCLRRQSMWLPYPKGA